MSHIGIYVHDVPKMEDFYTRVLGFTVTDRGKVRGMDIIVCTTARTDEEARALLRHMNFPFRQ